MPLDRWLNRQYLPSLFATPLQTASYMDTTLPVAIQGYYVQSEKPSKDCLGTVVTNGKDNSNACFVKSHLNSLG